MATITRIATGESDKKFVFASGELKDLSDQITALKVTVDFPGDDDTVDSSFSISLGQDYTITLQFKLYYQTTDRSDGTESGGVQTFQEIIPYLKRTIFKKAIGEILYRLQITTKFETLDGYFELNDFSMNTNTGIYPTGNAKFKFRRWVS